MSDKSVRAEVVNYNEEGDGTVVEVKVTSASAVPDEFQELRARSRALAATGYAKAPSTLIGDLELGAIGNLTQTIKVEELDPDGALETKTFTVNVNTP